MICTILYVAVSLVMVGLVPYTQLGVAAPMAVAIDAARTQAAGTAWAGIIGVLPFLVKLGAIAGLSSVMVVMMLGQPRIFYSMAHDGLLPAWAEEDPPEVPHAAHHDHRHRDAPSLWPPDSRRLASSANS